MRDPGVGFAVEAVETVVGRNERRAAGLDHWVDGTMGFHRAAGRTLVVAPNGPCLARHDVTDGQFIDGLLSADDRIHGLPEDVDHASGGPLYHDEASGLLLLVYHGETFRDADYRDYYAFLGMAVSDDDGESFHDLGRIVTSWLDEHDPGRPRPVDVGPGGFVVRDGWFHLYFQDRGILHSRRDLSVVRAGVAEVLDAARDRRTPVFTKYFDGRWCEPGLGGRSDELLPHIERRVLWFDAAYLESWDRSLIVYSTVEDVAAGVPRWNHMVTLSHDGLDWSTPQRLHDEALPAELLYVTIDSGGPCQRTVTGDRFDLYRVRSTASYRWDDARLERLTIRCSPLGSEGAAGVEAGADGRAGIVHEVRGRIS